MGASLALALIGAVIVGAGVLQVVDHIDIVFDPFTPTPREDQFACYAIALGCIFVAAGLICSYMETGK